MSSAVAAVLFAFALGHASGTEEAKAKPKKPHLDLRATPRTGFSPVTVFLTAELTGGDDVEEMHCPEVEWDWGDGGKSTHEGDCDPFEAGTKIQRRFTAEHEYGRSGIYNISVSLRRVGKTLAKNSVRVTVRPGLTERTTATEPQ
jgi:hypothetical protein